MTSLLVAPWPHRLCLDIPDRLLCIGLVGASGTERADRAFCSQLDEAKRICRGIVEKK